MNNTLTLKQRAFIKETAKTLNPTEAVRRVYNLKGKSGDKDKKKQITLATTIASENLTKPDIVRGIREEMEDKGVDNELITKITKRNLEQNKNLPASNQTLDMVNKIKGNYTPQVRVNIDINPDNINKLIDAKLNELKQLRAEG